MYGKIFKSMFEGSMRGQGDLQLTFTYLITHASQDGICDFTPQCIADATGKPIELIELCIKTLESPDSMSRTTTDEGRRIKRLNNERPWGWQIINYKMYRDIADRETMRNAEKLRKRAYRHQNDESEKVQCPEKSGTKPGLYAYAYAYTSPSSPYSDDQEFNKFWAKYPRKQCKSVAFEAWKKACSRPPIEQILNKLDEQMNTERWKRDDGRYIPMPSTYIHQERWYDEVLITGFSNLRKNDAQVKSVKQKFDDALRDCVNQFIQLHDNKAVQDDFNRLETKLKDVYKDILCITDNGGKRFLISESMEIAKRKAGDVKPINPDQK